MNGWMLYFNCVLDDLWVFVLPHGLQSVSVAFPGHIYLLVFR